MVGVGLAGPMSIGRVGCTVARRLPDEYGWER